MPWLIALAIAGAIAYAMKSDEPASQKEKPKPGYPPGEVPTKPECYDSTLTPAFKASLESLLHEADSVSDGYAAETVYSSLLSAATGADMLGAPKAAKCLRDAAAKLDAKWHNNIVPEGTIAPGTMTPRSMAVEACVSGIKEPDRTSIKAVLTKALEGTASLDNLKAYRQLAAENNWTTAGACLQSAISKIEGPSIANLPTSANKQIVPYGQNAPTWGK